mmetsp:Transcript_23441/g.27159  ORF Transcript_23441/g.27159 Transcript_23441/m.27159 type:complete len:778 (-) Transcript_23441:261-2594(-)
MIDSTTMEGHIPNAFNFEANRPMNPPPALVLMIYELLEGGNISHMISWHNQGASFLIKDTNSFTQEVLPRYFKHNSFPLFMKQLTSYGFQCMQIDNNQIELSHKLFIRGYKNLLSQITSLQSETDANERAQGKPNGQAADNFGPKPNGQTFGQQADYFPSFEQTNGYQFNQSTSSFFADSKTMNIAVTMQSENASHSTNLNPSYQELINMKTRLIELENYNKGAIDKNLDLIQQNKMLWNEHVKNKEMSEKKIQNLMFFIFSMSQVAAENGKNPALMNSRERETDIPLALMNGSEVEGINYCKAEYAGSNIDDLPESGQGNNFEETMEKLKHFMDTNDEEVDPNKKSSENFQFDDKNIMKNYLSLVMNKRANENQSQAKPSNIFPPELSSDKTINKINSGSGDSKNRNELILSEKPAAGKRAPRKKKDPLSPKEDETQEKKGKGAGKEVKKRGRKSKKDKVESEDDEELAIAKDPLHKKVKGENSTKPATPEAKMMNGQSHMNNHSVLNDSIMMNSNSQRNLSGNLNPVDIKKEPQMMMQYGSNQGYENHAIPNGMHQSYNNIGQSQHFYGQQSGMITNSYPPMGYDNTIPMDGQQNGQIQGNPQQMFNMNSNSKPIYMGQAQHVGQMPMNQGRFPLMPPTQGNQIINQNLYMNHPGQGNMSQPWQQQPNPLQQGLMPQNPMMMRPNQGFNPMNNPHNPSGQAFNKNIRQNPLMGSMNGNAPPTRLPDNGNRQGGFHYGQEQILEADKMLSSSFLDEKKRAMPEDSSWMYSFDNNFN